MRKSGTVFMCSNIQDILDEVDKDYTQHVIDGHGNSKVHIMHNTNPVYMVPSHWGPMHVVEIDNSLGCQVYWEIKV